MESRRKVEGQRGGGLAFGGKYDNEYVLRSMTWSDNYLLFSDSTEELIRMVNDIIMELVDWTRSPSPSHCGGRVLTRTRTVQRWEQGQTWDLPFMEVFDVLGFRFHWDGKSAQGTKKTLRKGLGVARWLHLPFKVRTHEDRSATGWSVVFSARL